jgi:hypothetical protein
MMDILETLPTGILPSTQEISDLQRGSQGGFFIPQVNLV